MAAPVDPQQDEVLPRVSRRRPTLQRHARHITSNAPPAGGQRLAIRIVERELEAGGLNQLRRSSVLALIVELDSATTLMAIMWRRPSQRRGRTVATSGCSNNASRVGLENGRRQANSGRSRSRSARLHAAYTAGLRPPRPRVLEPLRLAMSQRQDARAVRRSRQRAPPRCGVGTGWFLDHCRWPVANPQITLLDLNGIRCQRRPTGFGAMRPRRFRRTCWIQSTWPMRASTRSGRTSFSTVSPANWSGRLRQSRRTSVPTSPRAVSSSGHGSRPRHRPQPAWTTSDAPLQLEGNLLEHRGRLTGTRARTRVRADRCRGIEVVGAVALFAGRA